jgi:hypothetical protein
LRLIIFTERKKMEGIVLSKIIGIFNVQIGLLKNAEDDMSLNLKINLVPDYELEEE